MYKTDDDDLLADISRIAHKLNKNTLTEQEYMANGGKYEIADFAVSLGSFHAALGLCGLKGRK